MKLDTQSDCKLAISVYPKFAYNASGGSAEGFATPTEDGGSEKLLLKFDSSTANIPALNFRTASIFGIPIPPPLNIAIVPSTLEVGVKSNRVAFRFLFAMRAQDCVYSML